MTAPVSMTLATVLKAFPVAGYDVLIHVPCPEPDLLKQAAERFSPVIGFRVHPPRIENAERGVVRFLGMSGEPRRSTLENWLEAEYGWKSLPRPLRAHIARLSADDKDYVEGTERIFATLGSLGWSVRSNEHRIGSGLNKPGTPATDHAARLESERVRLSLEWQICWSQPKERIAIPKWVRSGGTDGNPQFIKSRFSAVEMSVQLLQDEDRFSLSGFDVLRQGLETLLRPLVRRPRKGVPIALTPPRRSSVSQKDWPPECSLEFRLP